MSFIRETSGGIEIHVRVTPNAKLDAIEGYETRDDGNQYLRIKTRAIADDNKANIAVCAIIAKALELAKSNVALVAGNKSRIKTLLVKDKKIDIDQAITKLTGMNNGCDNNRRQS